MKTFTQDKMSITAKVFASSAFQIALNLIQRSLGIISTLILARVLAPEDFGVIAILMLAMHLVDILSDAGSQQYIIQKQNSDHLDLNTAWSFDVISKTLLTLDLWLCAPYISQVLENPLLTTPIQIISISIPLRALRNPALILLAKELDYSPIFRINLTQKLLSFVSVMLCLVISPSYWAIVIGDLVAALVLLFGSYYINSYRPFFTLKKLKDQWEFSQWSLLRGITGFFRSQFDILVVSKMHNPAALGGYHIQRELALIPVFSLFVPAAEPLLTAIAKAKHDIQLFRYRVRISLLSSLIFLLPTSAFIFMFSKNIVSGLLGPQWIEQHQLLSYFSLMFLTFCFHTVLCDCFVALNKMKLLFKFDLASTVITVITLLLLSDFNLTNFALIRGITGLAVTTGLLLILAQITKLELSKLFLNTIPTITATFLASTVASMLSPTGFGPIVDLGSISLLFFMIFLLCYFTISYLAKPISDENLTVLVTTYSSLQRLVSPMFKG